jgi:hypothetical protein
VTVRTTGVDKKQEPSLHGENGPLAKGSGQPEKEPKPKPL